MSKLFEAISELENSGARDNGAIPFTPDSENKNSPRPGKKGLNRILVLALCCCLAGLSIVGILMFFHNRSDLTSDTGPLSGETGAFHIQTEKVLAVSGKKERVQSFEKKSLDEEKQLVQKMPEKMGMKSGVKLEKSQKAPAEDGIKHKTIKKILHVKVKKGNGPKVSLKEKLPVHANPNILGFRQKKLLYQAEKFRKKGDYSRALALYRKIWDRVKNPMIANNLAGILIDMGKYHEAKKVLKQALRLRPDDPDLNYNLQLADSCIRFMDCQ